MKEGKTQADIAAAIDSSQSTVTGWVQGKVPTAKALARLALAYGLSGHWLLTGKLPSAAPGAAPEMDQAFTLGWKMALRQAARALELMADPNAVSPAKSPNDLSEFEILRTDALTRQAIEDAEREAATAAKPKQGGA